MALAADYVHLSLQIILLLSTQLCSCEASILLIHCGTTNYTSGTLYESNLRRLFSNLTTATANSPSLYSTDVIGTSPSDQIFGLAQCRPDASAATCFNCLNSSAAAVADTNCPLSRSADIRSDSCVLRYSDQRFFSLLEETKFIVFSNVANASDPVAFNQSLHELMEKLSLEARKAESRFSYGAANYSKLGDIYEMAWCTQDLSGSDCEQCLDRTVGYLPSNKIGGQAVKVSCITRFETSAFISLLPPPSPSAQGAPQPTPAADEGGDASQEKAKSSSNAAKAASIIVGLVVLGSPLLCCAFFILRCRRNKAFKRLPSNRPIDQEGIRSAESLLFDLDIIRTATNDFSEENKLGEGGFGPVYKGLLGDGKQIAVKRLSRTSSQGFVELKNEVALVANLQHRNLVKLLGCCIEENEKLLVYEYLPNRSLDKFLFDSMKRRQLDWQSRYRIIEGIGRGLLYLHEDSRLRIIHRDLKASNILLDSNMSPKISDFGLARLFGIDQTHQNTDRIAGTYGYMAPEYAMHGLFSTKSDVFSYGVLIFEIITGRRNVSFMGRDSGHAVDLLSYVWQCWNQGIALQVVDECLGNEYQPQEVMRCMHIGLLCVQDDPMLRPNVASVMLMISSSSTTLLMPSIPPFYMGSSSSGESEMSGQRTVLGKRASNPDQSSCGNSSKRKTKETMRKQNKHT